MSRSLFVGSYLQVSGGLLTNGREEKAASNDNLNHCTCRQQVCRGKRYSELSELYSPYL